MFLNHPFLPMRVRREDGVDTAVKAAALFAHRLRLQCHPDIAAGLVDHLAMGDGVYVLGIGHHRAEGLVGRIIPKTDLHLVFAGDCILITHHNGIGGVFGRGVSQLARIGNTQKGLWRRWYIAGAAGEPGADEEGHQQGRGFHGAMDTCKRRRCQTAFRGGHRVSRDPAAFLSDRIAAEDLCPQGNGGVVGKDLSGPTQLHRWACYEGRGRGGLVRGCMFFSIHRGFFTASHMAGSKRRVHGFVIPRGAQRHVYLIPHLKNPRRAVPGTTRTANLTTTMSSNTSQSKPACGALRLRAGAGLLALGLPLSVAAQSTSSQPMLQEEPVMLDTFTVESGFRGSLAAAAELKQVIPAIAEVIAAEDIGKLPDVSIADSLSRLTGLATQRLNGRAQKIAVRGLAEDFTAGLLNGREQVSTASNRAIEFDQYPSELLSGVIVYKTNQANLIGQGMAGTIDMRTVRPLSQGRRTFVANTYYEWTEYGALNAGSDDTGLRYSASYIDQFADGKVGIAFGYSHADIPGQGKQWNAWGYPNVGAGVSPSEPYVLGGAKPFVRSSELKRDGYMGVIEFKPNDKIHSTIDLFYSKFDETQLLRGIEIPLFWSSAQLQPGFRVDNNVIVEGTFNNVYGVMRNDVVTYKNDVYSVGWNLTINDVAGWTVSADLNYSDIKRKQTVLETYSGTASNQVGTPDTIHYTIESGGGAIFTPALDYTDANLVQLRSPQGWGGDIVPGGQVGYLKNPTSKDELAQIKLAGKRDVSRIFKSIEVGAAYSDRYKAEVEDGYYLALANGGASAPLPSSTGITDLSFIGIPGMISYDPLAALGSGVYTRVRNPNADVVSSDWKVKEKVNTLFVMGNFDRKLGSVPMTGNIGVQAIHTDQSSKGLAATGTGNFARYLPVRGGDKYWDVLPSMNLSFQLRERTLLRFAAAKQMSRARMSEMRAGTNFGYNEALATSTDVQLSPWGGSGGNPTLKPWRADALDLTLEHYFRDNMGYFAVSGFYKKLKNYIYNQSVLSDFTGFPYTGGAAPALWQGYVTRPANGDGGSLKGVEASLSLPSELFNENIKGFGLVLNGAYTESSIAPNGPGSGTASIPGLSRRVASATLYYETGGFSARISNRYRSEYRGDIYTFGPRGANYQTIRPESVLDAQVSYAIQKGSLKGLTFILTANNLTDEPLVTENTGADGRLVIDYQRYGATYSAGVSYKF